ncbi:MAG: prepilin peptidase [Pirellulales bacterium]|nr:prepilin peptidase [Pirellulales bacterium]
MNAILHVPLELRLVGLFFLGACLGSIVNLGAYRLAWSPRSISPWSAPAAGWPRRRWLDRIPIFGWPGRRRESELHGRGFWIRPMVVELLVGLAVAWLYWWEIVEWGLLGPAVVPPVGQSVLVILHVQYVSHVLLMSLMLVASLIDADEKIIPDTITVPGAWLGLAIAAVFPWSLLPTAAIPPVAPVDVEFLRLTSPHPWPQALEGWPQGRSLVLGLGCWWLWCVGLMHRTWYSRHGWRRALALSLARLRRDPSTVRVLAMGLIGSAGIGAVWFLGNDWWEGLLSGLVGMAAGGLLIWLVRVIGTAVLGREAMGFGDVTLMAMLGSFLGWQSCLIIFFLAPFAGLLVGLITLILHRENEIPYGPFLCLAAVFLIVDWAAVWGWAVGLFFLGWLVPLVIVICMAMMAVLLGMMRLLMAAFR